MTDFIHDPVFQERLVQAMLPHVPFDGWTHKALDQAAEDLGVASEDRPFLFGGRLEAALEAYGRFVNQRLVAALAAQNTEGLGVTAKIKRALEVHFSLLNPLCERQTAKFFAHPLRVLQAQSMTFQLMDHMWHWAGDRSTDFNYYSKRLLLEAVFTSTMAYWLWQNPSPEALSQFMDQRLANVMMIPKAKARLKGMFQKLRP